MKTTTLFMFVLIIALGIAAVTTAISSVDQIDATSCSKRLGHDICNGCAKTSQGYESSEGKCLHD
jgi:hypothetical protein